MKISKFTLTNFKRFTDLTIDLTGGTGLPKLVLLIGANGSGKSGVFDAFETISRAANGIKNFLPSDLGYLGKNGSLFEIRVDFDRKEVFRRIFSATGVFEIDVSIDLPETAFFGRSAVRNMPRLTKTSVGNRFDIRKNEDRPKYYIDPDNRFENDIDRMVGDFVSQIFMDVNHPEIAREKGRVFLARFNEAFLRIFGDSPDTSLRFASILTPAEGRPVQLLFDKGGSRMNYDLLSSGEKEVVNILFNLFVRTPVYQDTVYFFDELDAHLHTSLQFNLLKEITENWIPENCQIWTATHSLGFIQYAQMSSDAAIIDFDNYDFDQSIELKPQQGPSVFEVAVPADALDLLFKDKKKVFCEGQNAAIFNSIGIENTVFLGHADRDSVFLRVADHPGSFGIIDRDFLDDKEVERLRSKFPKLAVLDFYGFENYLYHPDNLLEFAPGFDTGAYKQRLLAEKKRVEDDLISKVRNSRRSYVFFKKEEFKIESANLEGLFALIRSDDFEAFYKAFNMKGRKSLTGLKNVEDQNLAKTHWFKAQLTRLLPNG